MINWFGEDALELLDLMSRYKKILDDELVKCLSEIPELRESGFVDIAKYVVEGGKRIRGLTIIVVAYYLNGDLTKALKAAVAIELVHASSLALDDIIDNDVVRRGRPSCWVAFGAPKTILLTNILIPKAQLMVKPLGYRAIESVADTWLKVSLGETLDSFSLTNDYLRIIDLKTASLFQLSMELGLLASGRNDLVDSGRRYGLYIGRAYQIADDMVDYTKTIKCRGGISRPLRVFLEWIGASEDTDTTTVMTKGFSRMIEFIEKARIEAENMPAKELSRKLIVMPWIVINKMLDEGGLVGYYKNFFTEYASPA